MIGHLDILSKPELYHYLAEHQSEFDFGESSTFLDNIFEPGQSQQVVDPQHESNSQFFDPQPTLSKKFQFHLKIPKNPDSVLKENVLRTKVVINLKGLCTCDDIKRVRKIGGFHEINLTDENKNFNNEPDPTRPALEENHIEADPFEEQKGSAPVSDSDDDPVVLAIKKLDQIRDINKSYFSIKTLKDIKTPPASPVPTEESSKELMKFEDSTNLINDNGPDVVLELNSEMIPAFGLEPGLELVPEPVLEPLPKPGSDYRNNEIKATLELLLSVIEVWMNLIDGMVKHVLDLSQQVRPRERTPQINFITPDITPLESSSSVERMSNRVMRQVRRSLGQTSHFNVNSSTRGDIEGSLNRINEHLLRLNEYMKRLNGTKY